MRWGWVLLVVLAGGILVAGCGRGPGKTPTPTPTPAPVVTASPTRTPGLTPTPTRTPTSTPASTSTSAPTSTSTSTPASTPTSTPASTPAVTLNPGEQEVRDYLAVVFPPGPGREDLFLICTNCHGIHLVILTGVNMDRTEWEAVRTRHDTGGGKWKQAWTGRQEGQDLLYEYIVAHLGRDKPPLPPMPERLNEGWAQY